MVLDDAEDDVSGFRGPACVAAVIDAEDLLADDVLDADQPFAEAELIEPPPEPVSVGDVLADIMAPGWHELQIGKVRS